MTTLTVTRGLPGSGKTTWAREEALRVGAALVSRDELRAMLHPGPWPYGDLMWEARCTVAQHALIEALLRDGQNVIVHDTNLNPEHLRSLLDVGAKARAVCNIKPFTDVTLETCIERDAARPNPVGEQVIRGMWRRYLAPTTPVSQHGGAR